MENNRAPLSDVQQEINLKSIFQKVYQHKLFFISSIIISMLLAFAYVKLQTPQYEVSTSILIDTKGSNRALGDSQYVDGGVSLIEMEKNLYNEIGIIKSYNLINQTVREMDIDVSYYAENWFKKKEYYDNFLFEVELIAEKSQLNGIPFAVKILSDEKYRVSIKGDEFNVFNALKGSSYLVEKDFSFSKEFSFGEEVGHEYFNFVINKPEYEINPEGFKDKELTFSINNMSGFADSYMAKIDVANIDLQASIFRISSEGPIVNKEIDFLNKLTENYVQNKLDSRNKIATGKEAFIQNQLRGISDSLTQIEAKLESFKKNKRALNLGATATNALRQTQNLQVEKAKINLDINYYKSLIQNVEDNRNSENFEIPTAVGIDDPLINENIIELKRLYDLRAKKKFYLTNNNQEISILNKQISSSTDLLLNNLGNAVKSAEYSSNRVSSQISNFDGLIAALPTRENQLLNIQRQSTLYENLFKYLSQELAKAGIARAENTSDTRVLDEARLVSNSPVSPNKKLIMALGLFAGFIVPLAWVLLFSPHDEIENVNQIMAHCEIPVIASIINHDVNSKNSKSDVSLWKLKESFRDLSTNLRFVSSKETSVLGITSIMPTEGKTYNAINLGITFAEAGKKTLIIDTDLRNPSLVNRAHKFDGKGLSNYLEGDITLLNDIIYPHEELSNLEFIPTSVVEGNVHELLSSDKMKSLILELKEKYDYIILDTPAVGLVSDFLLFSEFIDINLFVVRRKLAKIKFLGDLEDLAFRDKKKKSFIIFNDVLKKDHKYGYEEKYGRNKEKKLISKSLSV